MARIEQLLQYLRKKLGSDLHLSAGSPPLMRVNGVLSTVGDNKLSGNDILRLVGEILTEDQRNHFSEFHSLDFSYESQGHGRYRANLFRQLNGVDACFRAIPDTIPALQNLYLPESIVELTNLRKGLVLIAGASGHGKSTTLASMISEINENRADHIISLEDPIEFLYPKRKSLINQRAVGAHTVSFPRALRAALRQDPDVISIGELRDLETIQLALTAAETGHLVFATLNTASAHKTIDRIIGSFPADQHNQIRNMLAHTFRGLICQQLLPRADGAGRIAAFEILIGNKAVSNLIRENRSYQLPSVIQTSSNAGMMLMDESLMMLVKVGLVDPVVAFYRAHKPATFLPLLPKGFEDELQLATTTEEFAPRDEPSGSGKSATRQPEMARPVSRP